MTSNAANLLRRDFVLGLSSFIALSAAWAPSPVHAKTLPPLKLPGYRAHVLKPGSFPRKWVNMITRHQAQNRDAALREDYACPWNRACREVRSSMTSAAMFDKVETLLWDVPYVSDFKHAGGDLWSTPREFLRSGGDCEDFAIARYFLLRSAGIPVENLAVMVCFDRMRGNRAHAITTCDIYNKVYTFDNQSPGPGTDWPLDRYKPLYSINENMWALYVQQNAFG